MLLPLAGQQEPSSTGLIRAGPPVPETASPLRKALLLLRQDRTEEARQELTSLLKSYLEDAEIHYQIARSHLMDFYGGKDRAASRLSLGFAMESLASAIRRNPDHVNALKAKSVIHARAELLYYDPDLAYEMAARVARLEPNAHEYLVSLSEWLSGEVRFTAESAHRVPHDPLLGLDRSIGLAVSSLPSSALPAGLVRPGSS